MREALSPFFEKGVGGLDYLASPLSGQDQFVKIEVDLHFKI